MAWQVSGNIRGPQGPQGPEGPKGDDGAGIEIAGSAPTYGDLPSGLGAGNAGAAYLVEADGKLYIWTGAAFPANGSGVEFRGQTGPKGDTGDQGIQGIQGPKGDQGEQGSPGTAGAKGEKGDTGDAGATGTRGSKWYTGTGAPTSIAGSIAGDMYLDTLDGSVYQLT